MNRFDVPESVKALLDKSVEIGMLDAYDIYTMGNNHEDRWRSLVDEIVETAYCNIHVNDWHDIICEMAEQFWKDYC